MSATPKLSHKFSGISVWLEPDPSQSSLLMEEMDYLMQQCGGPEAGMHRIIPHCTLLYNTSFPFSELSIDSSAEAKSRRQQRDGEDLLRQCLRDYHIQQDQPCACSSETPFNDIVPKNMSKIKMIPTSHYYFPYPKTADNGKGFGCCISLLILETTSRLKLLQEIVKQIFPADERHGGGEEHATKHQQHDDDQPIQEEVKFQPHMALIYAPEDHGNVTNGWLEERTSQMEHEKRYLQWISSLNDSENSDTANGGDIDDMAEMKQEKQDQHGPAAWDVKYLSIWSTEGRLDEWFPIAKIDLLPS